MRKYAIAAAFTLALATPALAAQYYVALDAGPSSARSWRRSPTAPQ